MAFLLLQIFSGKYKILSSNVKNSVSKRCSSTIQPSLLGKNITKNSVIVQAKLNSLSTLAKLCKKTFLGISSDKIYFKELSAIWVSFIKTLSQQNIRSLEKYILWKSFLKDLKNQVNHACIRSVWRLESKFLDRWTSKKSLAYCWIHK